MVWCLFGLDITAVALCSFTCVSVRVDTTHGSSPHRCCQSSHHHHRISIWWEYISYCCTETVHPRTPSQRQFQYLRTTSKRFTDNLRPSQYIYYCSLHNNTWPNRADPNTQRAFSSNSIKPWQRKPRKPPQTVSSFSAISDERVSVDARGTNACCQTIFRYYSTRVELLHELFLWGLKAEMWKHKAAVCL